MRTHCTRRQFIAAGAVGGMALATGHLAAHAEVRGGALGASTKDYDASQPRDDASRRHASPERPASPSPRSITCSA